MANTISAILPILQDVATRVPRESAGFANACYKNASAARAGKGQVVNYPIVPTLSAASVTPAATSSAGTDITQTAGSITMDTLEKVSWNWTGEEARALNNGDIAPYQDIVEQTLAQAIRTLTNRIENSLWLAAYKASSRAYGTAGTAPFATASDFSDFAGVARILDENGCPDTNRKLVLGHAAVNNLRAKQSSLFRVNEAGSAEFLRTGSLGSVMGFDLFKSHPISAHTKGSGASYLINLASPAVGTTTIPADTGSGTVLAGDIVTFAGTTTKYVVNSALSGGSFAIGKPGLTTAETDNDAITVGNDYTPNVAFEQMALHLVMRQPDDGMDGAADVATVTDPNTGLVFQLARYAQYMQSSWELRVLYGVKAVQSEFIATLIG